MSDRLGVMLCGHGSRDPKAIEEFAVIARKLGARSSRYDLEWGFLEFARPVIREGLDRLRARGHRRIFAVPAMLLAAGHVKNDVPSVLNRYQAEHGIDIRYGRDLGVDARLLEAAADSIRAAIAAVGDGVTRHDTLLVVVGRGTSDPDANSDVAKITRLLWEGFGFGWGETCYSGVTFPLVEPGLEHAARLGYRRIIVFPYFLFTGVLVRRIYDHTDLVAARHPGIEFVKAGYLNDHPLLLDTLADRIEELQHGTGNMNCQMCKYRTRILGFEDEVGQPQASHHHHVEGIGTGLDTGDGHNHGHGGGHGHDHDHGHAHAHAHGHAHRHGHDRGPGGADRGDHHPYPQADHPHGPLSLRRLRHEE